MTDDDYEEVEMTNMIDTKYETDSYYDDLVSSVVFSTKTLNFNVNTSFKFAQLLSPLQPSGEDDDGGEQTGELQIEIDNLNDEIRKLTDTLGEAIELSLKNSLWDLVWKLFEIYGDDFIEPFWTALDYDDIIEESIMAEEYETTGHGYMTISPIEQLTETVKDVAMLAEKIITDGKSSYNMVNAMVAALENMTSGSVKDTTSPSSAEESMESPDSSEEQAEIPSTTEGNTAEQTGTTEGTNAEQTSTPQGTTAEQTGTNEEHAENTDTTIATTESSVVRKENVLQRRLVDLLLKKLQKSAAKRGNEPPY
ncbi:uncharacterized protein LOC123540431 [Mercenaria mercenaria]|uniref:uncharacterized protein LOC123540431 n=1 Tax=Mercenaria mercenaria TaxID=6596 RepID=UPI00234F0BFB|nr:uncharacterized protein LOC123540431 [Mercenaria mercenaria]